MEGLLDGGRLDGRGGGTDTGGPVSAHIIWITVSAGKARHAHTEGEKFQRWYFKK